MQCFSLHTVNIMPGHKCIKKMFRHLLVTDGIFAFYIYQRGRYIGKFDTILVFVNALGTKCICGVCDCVCECVWLHVSCLCKSTQSECVCIYKSVSLCVCVCVRVCARACVVPEFYFYRIPRLMVCKQKCCIVYTKLNLICTSPQSVLDFSG